MVKKCCVYTCSSQSFSGCNISFHSFPKNKEMRIKWLSSIDVKQKITKNSVVCSRHFIPSCFYTVNSRSLLKANAIPTISPVAKNKKNYVLSDILLQQPQSATSKGRKEIVHPATSLETPVIPGTSSSDIEEPPRKKLCPNEKEVGVQTVYVKCMSPVENVLRRRVKVLSQRLNRRNEKLKNLQSLLLILKKKCKNFEEVEQNVKNNFSNIHTLLNTDKSNKGQRHSDEVKKFALSLYFYSSNFYL